MSPAEAAKMLAGLNWSGVPLDHQIAVSAALETLKTLVRVQPMTPTEMAQGIAFRHNGEPVDPLVVFAPEPVQPSNVIPLPVKPRTCWTTICHLDGRQWATSSHFGPNGAWAWIVESVAHEHGVHEDQVGCMESGEADPYDCDDLVTVDGLPMYRIQHLSR